ncbi:hypothetical protein BV22DRAFT_1036563 [Leucogyrophana mollusca]|uniref:Uncharacterized protein n=1 Tax=Leucogyrophana mollusca TaxID=85980 RepID=A0ACB8BET1_9AGAM|nr:hypothetical protein BV22DRAFT_1036563 [Leucogyrophana mollusca]
MPFAPSPFIIAFCWALRRRGASALEPVFGEIPSRRHRSWTDLMTFLECGVSIYRSHLYVWPTFGNDIYLFIFRRALPEIHAAREPTNECLTDMISEVDARVVRW